MIEFIAGAILGACVALVLMAIFWVPFTDKLREENAILRKNVVVEPPPTEDWSWNRHSKQHWTMTLNGSTLQYWPMKEKWHWKGKTYEATLRAQSVENFIKRHLRSNKWHRGSGRE